MGYSELKFLIESTKVRHAHETAQLTERHKRELDALLTKCTHTYEDGTKAIFTNEGHSRMDWWNECAICKRRL